MARIFIVEDQEDINNMIREALEKEGYDSLQAFSGTEARILSKAEDFDLVILDLMLPGLSGEDFLRGFRSFSDIPVIVLSALDQVGKKVDLMEMGANDYMVKPFDLKELIARIRVQLREERGKKKRIERDGLELDEEAMQVSYEGEALPLTGREYSILELLIKNPNKVFTKKSLFEYAWDDIYLGDYNTINVHISNIRKKLKALTDKDFIETVWGVGFKFRPEG